MPSIPYTVDIAPDVTGVTQSEFAAKIAQVLNDPRGWKKYGYNFYQVAEPRYDILRIHLETSDHANEMCGATGFSCWREGPNDIVMHLGNWMGGSKSTLPLDRYRNYVVSHEVGHYLGLEHQLCPIEECKRRGMEKCPCSVMQQVTRGPAAIAPCLESDWPLDPTWGIDDPRISLREQFAAWEGPSESLLVVIIAILAILLAIVAAAIVSTGILARVCTQFGRSLSPIVS